MGTETPACQHCGLIHSSTCPRIKAIDYFQDGTIKRVEFHQPVAEQAPCRPTGLEFFAGQPAHLQPRGGR